MTISRCRQSEGSSLADARALQCSRRRVRAWPQALLSVSLILTPIPAAAQSLSQRGFADGRGFFFPQEAVNDPTQAVGDLLVRWEVFGKPTSWLQLAGGVDARANTHGQVEDAWRLDFADRTVQRPRFSVRRLTATLTRGKFTLDLGKQFIRWGKADLLNPTDRFAPRDFLNVVDNEFLGVTGARATVQISDETFEAVWVPRFTPSRIPLLDQRWTAVPPAAAQIPLVDAGGALPDGGQAGVRWSHAGRGFESSLSFFDGFNHLPDIESVPNALPLPTAIEIRRLYRPIRTYGADAAVPTTWFTVKGETAYFTSTSPDTDEYVLYVVQLERQTGEWLLMGGYAGEVVTRQRLVLTFAPDRGLTRSVLGRATYTIDTNRSLAFEGVVRQNGEGAYAKAEYSQAHGRHWRATVAGTLIRGDERDFLGQYNRNSHVSLALRYSF